jgi:hypothetical protein
VDLVKVSVKGARASWEGTTKGGGKDRRYYDVDSSVCVFFARILIEPFW